MDLIALISFQDPSFRRGQLPIMYTMQPNGCHNCISHALDYYGYPHVCRQGQQWIMSRYIYSISKGEITPDDVVRHTCDNPNCINPKHLILGTVADNNRDRVLRNRSACGERNGKSRLKERDVIYIRDNPLLPTSELAVTFHVNEKTIWNVKNFKTWRHVASSQVHEVQTAA